MDEGRKRVIAIMAAILASLHIELMNSWTRCAKKQNRRILWGDRVTIRCPNRDPTSASQKQEISKLISES
jgi:hypothetical protein